MSDTQVATIPHLIADRWAQLPDRYDKQMLIIELIHDLKEQYPDMWDLFIQQAEYDLVREQISALEMRSRRADRAQMHREAVEARAASIESTGNVGSARYAVNGPVFASVRAMTLAEVLEQARHCRSVAAGATQQAQRWTTIADRMRERGCTAVGECWTDKELDAVWR